MDELAERIEQRLAESATAADRAGRIVEAPVGLAVRGPDGVLTMVMTLDEAGELGAREAYGWV